MHNQMGYTLSPCKKQNPWRLTQFIYSVIIKRILDSSANFTELHAFFNRFLYAFCQAPNKSFTDLNPTSCWKVYPVFFMQF